MSLSELERGELLSALRADAARFGPALAREAAARGLAVTDAESGAQTPIPVTATPICIDRAELQRRQHLSALLSSAGLKMSRTILAQPDRAAVASGLSPLELEVALATFERLDVLATTRVDFFAGDRALELNATIPAMQGYSDIAAGCFLEQVGRLWGAAEHVIAGWKARNGSNALALYRALLSGAARVRPQRPPERMALLCRRNDAQLSEQHYLCQAFRDLGADADVVFPDQLSGTDAVRANGRAYDLVYRHLFVRRLEEGGPGGALQGAAYVKSLLLEPNGTRAVVLNPPASQVEVKAVFALLSQAAEDRALAERAHLSEEELAAIRTSVPWTRVLQGQELVAQVAAHPDRYVLKRSWDYGGRAVFVGSSQGSASFGDRVLAAFGEPLAWPALCARAAADPRGGGFVVQERVETSPEPHLLCSPAGVQPAELYVDFSTYASVGLDHAQSAPAWGGVCRGSLSQIVNIVGGGGVLPLIDSEVARSLLMAHRARPAGR